MISMKPIGQIDGRRRNPDDQWKR